MPDETSETTFGSSAASEPQADPQSSSSAPRSLEGLPFEIQRLIMSQAPTLDTLSAIVHASPQFHRVYIQDRLRILRDFVAQSLLDGVLVDAHAAYLSGRDEFQHTRDEPMLWDFLDAYQHRCKTVQVAAPDLAAQLPLDHVIGLAHFHRSVIEPLTDKYATWALAALSSSPGVRGFPLSGTERRRIQRALYRFQVFCNVCGSRGEGRSSPRHIGGHIIGGHLQRVRVLSLFPAWQVEEILCVHEFAKNTYGGVFDQVAWDLNEERNPRYRHIDMTDVNEDLLLFSGLQCYINKESRDSMLRHGLTLLSAVFKTTDHEELVELVRQSIISVRGNHGGGRYDDWIDEAVQWHYQEARREQWYSEHDAAQDRRESTPFHQDTLDLPPLAWVTFWKGEASNLFGVYVPNTFRR